MLPEILYKYRSLADCISFGRFVDIILNKRLYAASYKEFQEFDPLEGHYRFQSEELKQAIRTKLQDDKKRFRLCSLSQRSDNAEMWSQYADNQKGVAIGVKMDIRKCKYEVIPIDYNSDEIVSIDDQWEAIDILSHKLKNYANEEEVRVFVKNEKWIKVQIEEVITGRSMSKEDYTFLENLIKRIDPSIKITKA